MANARRGDGRGEVKGEAVEDLVRVKAGAAAREALVLRGEAFDGVDERSCDCHGAGLRERTTVAPRIGGGEEVLSFALFHRHSAPNTASSSALPMRLVGPWRKRSSSLSVLDSSSSASSFSTGSAKSYILSDTISH